MPRQQFQTTDVLAVEVQEPWPGLPNLVSNPSGGTSGVSGYWRVADEITLAASPTEGITGTNSAAYTAGLSVRYGPIAVTQPTPQPGARHVRAQVFRVAGPTGVALKVNVHYVRQNGATGSVAGTLVTTGYSTVGGSTGVAVPSDTKTLELEISSTAMTPGQQITFARVALVFSTPALVGPTTMPLQWQQTWLDLLGPSHDLKIERPELNLGTLVATILDSNLDPANEDAVRPGRTIRAALKPSGEKLFTGTVLSSKVTYDLKTPNVPDRRRTRIELTAVDPLTILANTPRTKGVATIAELPYVLDGTGVPYVVNGSTASVDPADVEVVATNDAAKAIDQVAITRDSVLGYAWLDRNGVLQAWDNDLITTTVAATYGDNTYTGLDIDFDTDRCINSVTIKLLVTDATGQTSEVAYGPYVNPDSVRTWGAKTAEFTVQGLDEPGIAAYAAAILSANATPTRRINSITLPLMTTAHVTSRAVRDLYDLVTVSNSRAGLTQKSRVVSVVHRITPNKWLVDLGFAAQGGVAQPQVTPSPTVRPVSMQGIGDLKDFYGTLAQAEANNPGWLVAAGGSYDTAKYPKLLAHLQVLVTAGLHADATLLPNFNDRFTIGAGVKALGSAGGSSTKTLVAANLPPHTHPIPRGTAAGTVARVPPGNGTADEDGATGTNASGTGGNANPFDVMPPWRAAYKLIRAA